MNSPVLYGGVFICKWLNENKKIHREDGPSLYFSSGGRIWSLNGLIHREDGPAIESINGDISWRLFGVELLMEDYCDIINQKLCGVMMFKYMIDVLRDKKYELNRDIEDNISSYIINNNLNAQDIYEKLFGESIQKNNLIY